MSTKITSPVAGYKGEGPGGLVFDNGVAHTDNVAIVDYCRQAGYLIDGRARELTADELEQAVALVAATGQLDDQDEVDAVRQLLVDSEPGEVRRAIALHLADPRLLADGGTAFGSRLRDSAVDPQPGDFLPPTNAGQANPHGPEVVAPGIHAEGESVVRPGEVHADDVRRQERAETDQATGLRVEGKTVATVVEQFIHAGDEPHPQTGPLGLSDPGSADKGQREATSVSQHRRMERTDPDASGIGDTGEVESTPDDDSGEGGSDATCVAVFVCGESDPKDFTVAQVQAHLEQADEAERDRVLDLEQNGKARTTLLTRSS